MVYRHAHDVRGPPWVDRYATFRALCHSVRKWPEVTVRHIQAWESRGTDRFMPDCTEPTVAVHRWYIPATVVHNGRSLPYSGGEVQRNPALTSLYHV